MNHFRITGLKKILIKGVRYDCTAKLTCDGCLSRKVNIKFQMAPPGYTLPSGFGFFYGDNLDQCIWYGALFDNQDWWHNSDFINLCPSCQKKFKIAKNRHITDEQRDRIREISI